MASRKVWIAQLYIIGIEPHPHSNNDLHAALYMNSL
jgi:hypothetical protein